jgi:hypothetical protein
MKLREFGAGGLANICLGKDKHILLCICIIHHLYYTIEPRHHEYITESKETRDALVACLENTNADAVKINAITCLMQLVTKDNHQSKLYKGMMYYYINSFLYSFIIKSTRTTFKDNHDIVHFISQFDTTRQPLSHRLLPLLIHHLSNSLN